MIEEVCASITSIGAAVEGITTAIDPPPVNLNSANLPAQVIFTGQAQRDDSAGPNLFVVTRMYRVQVAAIPTGQGNPNARETVVRPLLQAHVAAFETHPTLGKLAGVRSAKVVYDSGVILLMEYGQKYIGYEIGLQVVTVERRTIAKGE
jgi:hypothetical protein